MRARRSLIFTLIFTFFASSTAPIKAEGTGYAKWLMAGIGCFAATVLSYSWLKAGYWGYKITKQLPKTDGSGSMSLTAATGYLQLIKALPELHSEDGVKTFVWGHRIQQKLKQEGIVFTPGKNQAKYLQLLHALQKSNPQLRDNKNDEFILWIYKLQKAMGESQSSAAMSQQEQLDSVMLLHKNPFLHNGNGMRIILFALRVQKELNTNNPSPAKMSDDDKMYYLNLIDQLFKSVEGGLPKENTQEYERWVNAIVKAKQLQQKISSGFSAQPNGQGMTIQTKIKYIKWIYDPKKYASELQREIQQNPPFKAAYHVENFIGESIVSPTTTLLMRGIENMANRCANAIQSFHQFITENPKEKTQKDNPRNDGSDIIQTIKNHPLASWRAIVAGLHSQ